MGRVRAGRMKKEKAEEGEGMAGFSREEQRKKLGEGAAAVPPLFFFCQCLFS